MTDRPTRPIATAERFFTKVDMTEDCWMWTASKHPFGHGQFRAEGRKVFAHRWLYELLVGPIPEGLSLDHLCRVPACVRPSHLEPVTHRENVLRGVGPSAVNARKTHCPQGHPYNEVNTHVGKKGGRICRTCHRDLVRASYRAKQTQGRDTSLADTRRPCSVCGIAYRVKLDGALFRHNGVTLAGFSTGGRCPGAGLPPAAA